MNIFDLLFKDKGFKHKHDNWPEHPIGVKNHAEYIRSKGQVSEPAAKKKPDNSIGYVMPGMQVVRKPETVENRESGKTYTRTKPSVEPIPGGQFDKPNVMPYHTPKFLRGKEKEKEELDKVYGGKPEEREQSIDIKAVLKQHFGDILTQSKLDHIFSGDTVLENILPFRDGKLTVNGTIGQAGKVRLSFFEDHLHERLAVNIDRLSVGDDSRHYLHNLENKLKKIGATSIYASQSGASWASRGFDFATDIDQWNMYKAFRNYVNKNLDLNKNRKDNLVGVVRGKVNPHHLSTLKHSWDFATWNPLNAPPGHELGREAMRGVKWRGFKTLDDNSESYKRGLQYWGKIMKGEEDFSGGLVSLSTIELFKEAIDAAR